MAKVAFLGLGVMGYPMAGHLQKKGGHEVTVYNRTPAKACAVDEGVRRQVRNHSARSRCKQ
jgi:3-hydroxyisobutyrate dehydrogenase-like beta-hydroxyacid dehydrogenase